jgi:hypothetical protein
LSDPEFLRDVASNKTSAFVRRNHSPTWCGAGARDCGGGIVTQENLGIQPIGIREPARPARGDAGNPPCNAAFAQFVIFSLKQAKQRPVDVAEAEQTKIVGTNE